MDKLILSFDLGTQSVRALLFNKEGRLIDKVKQAFTPYFSNEEGYAEQHPSFYFEQMCAASKKLRERNSDIWDSVIGVAVTSMRDVGVCLDKDKNVLRPAILWMDRRKASLNEKLPLSSRLMFKLSAMTDIVAKKRVDCKCNWIRENEAEIWSKTDKYAQLSAYINYCLTGVLKDSVASTIGHIPFNYKAGQWYKDSHYMSACFKVPNSKLYDLVKPSEIIGYISEEASSLSGIKSGLPLYATGSDKGCETIGVGAIYDNTASISFGTTATIQLTTKKYVEPLTFLPAYPAVYNGYYNPEIMIYRGYWMLTWFVDQFIRQFPDNICHEKELDKKIEKIPPCCDGLYVEPYWGPGIKSPEAKGAIIGFTESHTLPHIYKAIIEGINFALLEGLYNLQKRAKVKVDKIMVSGGGANSDIVCQITADMFNLKVVRVQTCETSGLGAAICSFVGAGEYNSYDDAIKGMVHEERIFMPEPKNAVIYSEFYDKIYKGTYKRIKPIFKRLKKIKGS